MRRNEYRFIVRRSLMAVFLLILMTFSVTGAAAAFKNIKVGDQGLPVQLNDLDGQEHSLARYKDAGAVLMLFWATWSQKSILELEDLQKFHEQYGDKGLQVLAINVENQDIDDEDLRQIRAVIEEHGIGFPVLIDYGLKTYNEWGVIATPTAAIVDGDGTVSYDLSSYPTSACQDMDEAIQKALGLWVEEVVAEDSGPSYKATKLALLHLGLGKRHAEKGFMTKALPEFEKAAVADSGWADPNIYLGFVHLREGDNDKAKESLERAARLDPGREETTLLTGYLLVSGEKVDEAIALLQGGEPLVSQAPDPSDPAKPEADISPADVEPVKSSDEGSPVAEVGPPDETASGGKPARLIDLSEVLALQADGKASEAASALEQLLTARLGELGFTMEKKKKVDAMEKMRLMMQKKQQGQ
ncbi:MAG: redoxin domain-containing protein [bacterium]|nr:redoxin domain-containing protein [bacterium]